ncbi:unnamed protein product [Blepharisma stoltei]|uniref:Uncharacterized protein n=1 Tax=Blepharisma stoltei TaxID=1481888 RepID=A0AAU9JNA2_9CILI|nr:unnamed protein product [Blepharisma stoltei]
MEKTEWLLQNLDKLDEDQTVEAYKLMGKTLVLPFCATYAVSVMAFSKLVTPRIMKWPASLHLVLRVLVPLSIGTYSIGVSTYYTHSMYEKFYEDFIAKQKAKNEEGNIIS